MTVSYERAGEILDELMETIPEGIFDKLNGGVNFLEETKQADNGDYILGLYHVNEMGRYVELFYGSFVELFGDMDEAKFADELKNTLHHELTHHVENLAGDRSLEKWDEEQALNRLYGYIQADSILFVDDDGQALAPLASALFKSLSLGKLDDVTVSAACIDGFSGAFSPEAASAAESLGVKLYPQPVYTVTDVLLKDYSCVLCMTIFQARLLADRFPQFDERIMTLGETDIKPPLFKKNWPKTALRVKEEIEYLIAELCEGEDA